MNENLYKYLCDNKLLLHGIGEITEIDTFKKFVSIFETGGLLSKERLKEIGINVEGKSGDCRVTPESVISLFDPALPQFKKRLLSPHYYYYLPFHPNVIFFMINRSNLNLKLHKTGSYEIEELDGFIPLSNFVGILSPLKCIHTLQEFLKNNNINIPLYDIDFNSNNLNQNVQSNQKSK